MSSTKNSFMDLSSRMLVDLKWLALSKTDEALLDRINKVLGWRWVQEHKKKTTENTLDAFF